ncbi:LOW QUALITY PROTEIN: hypothetical protein PHMEG_00025039 [Phytophthora megakarya]|uniref:Uncharacterized protein n=1 Tax=Phytophthora megakarya TaxID=4795 RepID=A0A225VD15_9STRA|nr:LOW QUALITY PROTEIN: hypothetical protein PHMEG_00025039 [Phytophthora megakarya]
MSLQDLAPENTKRAQTTAISTFKSFLASENTDIDFVYSTLQGDEVESAFVKLLDRFAMYLAFSRGRGGEVRKKNTVMSCYRNVKNWLLEKYPQHRNAIAQRLLTMGRILMRHCMKRQQGGTVTKAPACTKADLHSLVNGLYFDATSSKECVSPLHHVVCIGRASGLAFIQKCNLSGSSGNVLFLRLIRAKTSEEQGLSLFPDKTSFTTCPLHAIGTALAMQTYPVSSVLDLEHLAKSEKSGESTVVDSIPLTEALLQCDDDTPSASTTSEPASQRHPAAPLKMQSYVNRVLKVACSHQEKAGVSAVLSSHSFRRGGTQRANANSSLSPQWIFDRGSWKMTATNKAFAYVFNTTNEDRKVSKVLSDWKCDDNPSIPSLSGFDSGTASRIRGLMRLMFASSLELSDSNLTMDPQVAELLECRSALR